VKLGLEYIIFDFAVRQCPEANNQSKYLFIYLFTYFAVLGLEIRAFTLSHSTSPFCDGYF
jgi:hypothetical protein